MPISLHMLNSDSYTSFLYLNTPRLLQRGMFNFVLSLEGRLLPHHPAC